MICKHYDYGYIDEFSRYHVVVKTDKGYMTYSYDTLIAINRIKNNKQPSEQIINHRYIGKSFIGHDGKKRTIKEVWRHFGFGDYYVAIFEDDKKSGGTFTLLAEGSGIEKMFCKDSKFIEDQLV